MDIDAFIKVGKAFGVTPLICFYILLIFQTELKGIKKNSSLLLAAIGDIATSSVNSISAMLCYRGGNKDMGDMMAQQALESNRRLLERLGDDK